MSHYLYCNELAPHEPHAWSEWVEGPSGPQKERRMITFHSQRKGAGCQLPPIDLLGTTWACPECGQVWIVAQLSDGHEYARPYRAWVHWTDYVGGGRSILR